MKIRFFRVLWVVCVMWLGLLISPVLYRLSVGKTGHDFFSTIVFLSILGLPALLGLAATYIVTGSLLWPKDRNSN